MTRISSLALMAVLGLGPLVLPTVLTDPPAEPASTPVAIGAKEQLVNGLMSAISRNSRPLPGWAIDMANRAYDTWKLHRFSQRVGEIEEQVVVVLRIVADLKNEIEAGRRMSESEMRLTRKLLDARSRLLDSLISRIDEIEQATKALKVRIPGLEARNEELEERNSELGRRFYRPGCGVGRAWRNGRCEDVAADRQ